MIEFTAIRTDNGEVIVSNCIIQDKVKFKKRVKLRMNGKWFHVKPNSLKVRIV